LLGLAITLQVSHKHLCSRSIFYFHQCALVSHNDTAFNQPSAVWISGQLWGVVQTSFFRQGHNERICSTTECRGRVCIIKIY